MKKGFMKYSIPQDAGYLLHESEAPYITSRMQPAAYREVLVKDFTYKEFKKIADKSPFTLNEWASLLYISERTLHRYAKDGSAFNGLQIERILLLENFIDAGTALFGKEGLKNWLVQKPFSLNGATVKELLATHEGILEVTDLIGRLQHGIVA